MSQLKEVLQRRTEQSALLLRKVLGKVQLDPKRAGEGKPYYLARTELNALALLDPPPEAEPREAGSNLRWWRKRYWDRKLSVSCRCGRD